MLYVIFYFGVKTKKAAIAAFLQIVPLQIGSLESALPSQRTASLVFNHSGFKEVFLFAQVHDFAHPREGVLGVGELLFEAEL